MDHGEVETSAAKALAKMDRQIQRRIYAAIVALGEEPRPIGCTKMSGMSDTWRVRVGDYRVVYSIADSVRVVTVTKVAHRREVYGR